MGQTKGGTVSWEKELLVPKSLSNRTLKTRLWSVGLLSLGLMAFGYHFSQMPTGAFGTAVAAADTEGSADAAKAPAEPKVTGEKSQLKKPDATARPSTQPRAAKESGKMPPADAEKVTLTEAEWRKRLTPEQFRVLRKKGTERPFVNKFDEHFEAGTYSCAACGQELFESDTKFNSGCGWPAFYASKAGDRVNYVKDFSHGMLRVEVTCAKCDSHLGHVFNDAPQTPTGNRYCINSVSLKFEPKKPQKD